MKKSSQPLSPGNFKGWVSAQAAESGSSRNELYRRMMAEASAAANAALKRVKAAENEEMQIQKFASAAKPGTVIRRAAPAPTQIALPRMRLPAFLEEEEAAEAAAAAANLGLRLNLKSAGIPSTFNNYANFSEYTENPPLGVYFNRQRNINEGKRKEARRQALAEAMAPMSPLGRLAQSRHAFEEHMRATQGPNAVRMGLAPLPSTPGSMPPPKMYMPGQEVPGSSGVKALMNNKGGRRRTRHKRRISRRK